MKTFLKIVGVMIGVMTLGILALVISIIASLNDEEYLKPGDYYY